MYNEYHKVLDSKFQKSTRKISSDDMSIAYFKLQQDDYERVYAKTCITWSRVYGEAYGANPPSYFAWQRGRIFMHLVFPPIGKPTALR